MGFAIACGGHTHLLAACLRSIVRNSPKARVAVVFDGCEPDEEVKAAAKPLDHHFTYFPEQRGIAAAWNAGIRACDSELTCVLNDDTELPSSVPFDQSYVDFFTRHPEVRIACSLDRLTAWSVLPFVTKQYPKSWGHDRLSPETSHVDTIYTPYTLDTLALEIASTLPDFARCRMNGACFVLTREATNTLGFFDEQYAAPGTHEDLAYWCSCLERFGLDSMGTYTRSFVHHIRTATISNYPREWANAQCAKNSEHFRSVWSRGRFGAQEDWFSIVNALPLGAEEPPFPT